MTTTWISQIETWNARVQSGDGNSVAREINRIPRDEIPLELLAKIANLAWRTNRPSIGLRLLFTELRRQNNLKVSTHPEAFSEYAACLLEAGALSEAKRTLREVQGRTPRSKFYFALLLFKEWDYESAIPLLEDYIQEIPADYHQMVTRVNLASAYVNIKQWEKGEALLKSLQIELTAKSHWLLLGNCFEIESQIHFDQHRYEQALQCLEKSETHLNETKNMGWLYCKKWQFLNRLYRGSRDLEPEFDYLKATARHMHSWETLRELDLHWALQTGDSALINHVYYGSSAPLYRQKISQMLKDSEHGLEIMDQYIWSPEGNLEAPAQMIDLNEEVLRGRGENSQSFLMKKLLLILVSDFYSPFRVGQIFSELFADEFYNLETSPDRVFQIIQRLRSWLALEHPGCEIISSRRGYSLRFAKNCGVVLRRSMAETKIQEKSNVHYLFLRQHFASDPFTATELSGRLNCSVRSANRVLKELKSIGKVSSEGRGRFIRFKLVS